MPRTASPLDAESACPAAQYEKAYLHHLVRSNETLGAMLLSFANVAFINSSWRARAAIAESRFADFVDDVSVALHAPRAEERNE